MSNAHFGGAIKAWFLTLQHALLMGQATGAGYDSNAIEKFQNFLR